MQNKRGLSAVVTTLIIILLVIVSIAIVWVVISNVISQGAEEISLGKFTVDAEIENVVIDNSTNNISLNVKRKVGQGEVSGVKFIFDTTANSEIITENISLRELESRRFYFHLDLDVDEITSISIVPVFTAESGNQFLGSVVDSYSIALGTSTLSCTANCTGRVCGNDGCGGSCGSCGGGEYCSSGTCVTGSNPCDLSSANWSHINVYDGTIVSLNLTGVDCTGIDINFSIYEDDFAFDDYVISIVSSFSSTTWASHWTYAGDDDSGDDQRDYYFIASVVDNPSEFVTSGLLNVSQTACTPDCSCASTTCTGSTCSDGCGGTCPGTLAPDCGARECGAAPNGCGTANQCGTCSGSDVCVSGTCQSSCTPAVNPCGSYECGLVQNGTCGNVSCGTCSGSETCVGGSCTGGGSILEGLVHHWGFNGDATDGVGSYDGIIMGSPSLVSDRGGSPNEAYYFRGGDYEDYIVVGEDTEFGELADGGFSFASWIYVEDSLETGTIIGREDNSGSNQFFRFQLNGWGYLRMYVGRNGTNVGGQSGSFCYNGGSGVDYPINEWFFAAGTWDNEQGIITTYLNGLEYTSYNCSFNSVDPVAWQDSESTYIGAYDDSFGPAAVINASLDDVRVYNRTLSSSEVLDLYNLG